MTIRMTNKRHRGVANVPKDDIHIWEAAGWVADKIEKPIVTTEKETKE